MNDVESKWQNAENGAITLSNRLHEQNADNYI
jgi:hypothetical protein